MFRRARDVSRPSGCPSLPMLPNAVSQEQLKGILLNIIANVDVDIPIICNVIKCVLVCSVKSALLLLTKGVTETGCSSSSSICFSHLFSSSANYYVICYVLVITLFYLFCINRSQFQLPTIPFVLSVSSQV